MRTIDAPALPSVLSLALALLLNACATSHVPTSQPSAATEPSVPVLRRQMRSPDGQLREAAFDAAYGMGPQAIPLLTEMLRDRRLTNRRAAADLLIDLAPETESVQASLCRALKDGDATVAGDAARALGALGERAGPSVPALAAALAHPDVHVRLYAAEALAAVGAAAAPVTAELAQGLHDDVPGVRWAACEALASIGPAAAPAVPELTRLLDDRWLFVRICAAGALGSIGPEAASALPSLQRAAADPALAAEAARAMSRIAGAGMTRVLPARAAVPARDTVERGTGGDAVASRGDPPVDWDLRTRRNILWDVELGGESFGRPVVAGHVVYVGTDNALCRDPAVRDPCGVLAAFDAVDGAFLWQDASPRVERGLRQFLLPSTTSAPLVEGDRLYYLTAECQLRCLDTRRSRDSGAAALVWELDLCARLGVFPHEACNSEVLPVGNLVVVCTSNGRNEGHTRVPSPLAPSLVAVDKRSGEVVWSAAGPGQDVLHGQWCSPSVADVNGRPQVLFGGGDGWLRAYDAASGAELWRFDGNPEDARWRPRPGVLSRCPIVASPAYADGRVFVAMGEDPTHGDGPSLLHAVSPDGQGDVTGSRRLWSCDQVGRVVGTPIVKDGLLYVGDLGGKVCCVDAATGVVEWKHETGGPIWGCLLVAGDRVYVGNVEGRMTVLRAGRRKKVLARIDMDEPMYSRPALVGDAMYLATARRLYAIAKPQREASERSAADFRDARWRAASWPGVLVRTAGGW